MELEGLYESLQYAVFTGVFGLPFLFDPNRIERIQVSSRLGKGNATSCHLKGEQDGRLDPGFDSGANEKLEGLQRF